MARSPTLSFPLIPFFNQTSKAGKKKKSRTQNHLSLGSDRREGVCVCVRWSASTLKPSGLLLLGAQEV